MANDTQNSLITKIVAFLNANGFVAWRQENQGRFDTRAAGDAMARLVWALTRVPNYDAAKARAAIDAALGKCWRKVPGGTKGVADVIGWQVGTGRWVAVEVKIGTDALRPEQIEWLGKLKRDGGTVFVIRDYDSFVDGFWRMLRADETV